MEIALEHGTDDFAASVFALLENAFPDERLAGGIFARVGMAAIDHDDGVKSGFSERLAGGGNAGGVVVAARSATAKDEMAFGVSRGLDDARGTVLIDAEETVRSTGGLHRIDGCLDAAVRAVFESDGHGESAGHFAMGLGFRRARPDGSPTDEVGDVLRDDGVEEFCAGGQAEFDDIEEEFAGGGDAVGDVAGVIEVGVVNEAFPTGRRPWFFEINAHNDEVAILNGLAELGEAFRVFESCLGVVDGAGADDNKEAIVFAAENRTGGGPGAGDIANMEFGCRALLFNLRRGNEAGDASDAEIFHRDAVELVL